VSEEATIAAQDPAEEQQYLAEGQGDQETNLNSKNYTTDQGKPWCIPPYYYYEFYHLLYTCVCALSFIGIV